MAQAPTALQALALLRLQAAGRPLPRRMPHGLPLATLTALRPHAASLERMGCRTWGAPCALPRRRGPAVRRRAAAGAGPGLGRRAPSSAVAGTARALRAAGRTARAGHVGRTTALDREPPAGCAARLAAGAPPGRARAGTVVAPRPAPARRPGSSAGRPSGGAHGRGDAGPRPPAPPAGRTPGAPAPGGAGEPTRAARCRYGGLAAGQREPAAAGHRRRRGGRGLAPVGGADVRPLGGRAGARARAAGRPPARAHAAVGSRRAEPAAAPAGSAGGSPPGWPPRPARPRAPPPTPPSGRAGWCIRPGPWPCRATAPACGGRCACWPGPTGSKAAGGMAAWSGGIISWRRTPPWVRSGSTGNGRGDGASGHLQWFWHGVYA